MFEKLNARLAAAKEQGRLQAEWGDRLERLRRDLQAEERKLRLWEEQLAMEERDTREADAAFFPFRLAYAAAKQGTGTNAEAAGIAGNEAKA